MGDYTPKYQPGADLTRTASGTVTGGQIVTVAGAAAGADAADFLGVARQDATSGKTFLVTSGGVQRVVAAGAIAAGARVKCAAAGKVTTFAAASDNSDLRVGIALEAAAADGDELDVKFDR